MNRRQLLQSVAATSMAASGRLLIADAPVRADVGRYKAAFALLDRYVEQFMRDMHAPGMTVVLADREGTLRLATYGFGDIDSRSPVKQNELFQVGSISKSFVALCLLQLRDEGKLDLHRPVISYLPWLKIESRFGAITAHHLLTHTSGLPGAGEPFLSDPAAKHVAATAPGEFFYYNNMAYTTLGYLAETLDGRELPQLFRARILEPLGMTESEPVITVGIRDKFVKSYGPFFEDRPYWRDGRLCEAPFPIVTGASGCVASTARDMGYYIRMIANRGVGPRGRLISEESFELFSTLHIVDGAGPEGYGYGVFVDTLDGHPVVRHTGGMVSFASSMFIELDNGVAGFSSINAMQGYRPTPVMEYAVRLMAAVRNNAALPAIPEKNVATAIANAADYIGTYGSGNRSLQFVAEGNALFLLHRSARVALETAGAPDTFLIRHRDFDLFPVVFGRKGGSAGPVVEAGWGADWYPGERYEGARSFDSPKEWNHYVGHYRNDSPWMGSIRIVLRKGQLYFNGVVPLERVNDAFYLRDDPRNPEWIRFADVVNGRAMRLKFSGTDAWRVAAS